MQVKFEEKIVTMSLLEYQTATTPATIAFITYNSVLELLFITPFPSTSVRERVPPNAAGGKLGPEVKPVGLPVLLSVLFIIQCRCSYSHKADLNNQILTSQRNKVALGSCQK